MSFGFTTLGFGSGGGAGAAPFDLTGFLVIAGGGSGGPYGGGGGAGTPSGSGGDGGDGIIYVVIPTSYNVTGSPG